MESKSKLKNQHQIMSCCKKIIIFIENKLTFNINTPKDWDNKLTPCTQLPLSSNTLVQTNNYIQNFTTGTFKVIFYKAN